MKLTAVESVPLDRVAPSSRLGVALFAGEPVARPFYRWAPGEFELAAAEVRGGKRAPRGETCDALAELNASLGAGDESMASIERLRREGTLAVVAGQQTAPLTGPLYTVLKAATAVHLARHLEKERGIPCVPVFWAEGDDHDAAEIERVGLGWVDHTLAEIVFSWPAESLGGPIGDLVPSLDPAGLRRQLSDLLPPTEFREEVLETVFRGISGEEMERVGPWFGRLLLSLFPGTGLVIAYSRHPALRVLWREMAELILEEGPALMEEIEAAGDAVEKAGFRPQIRKRPGQSPFFIVEGGQRRPVLQDAEGFSVGGRRLSPARMRDALFSDPRAFSPGVAVRAVLQDFLLPTVAYVSGLSEAAYFGQLQGIYRRLGVVMPVLRPRFSATFIEPGQSRLLERHRLAPSRFILEAPEAIFASLVSSREALLDAAAWEDAERRSVAPLREMRRALPAELEPLGGHLDRIAGRIIHEVRGAREKTARAVRAREEETRRQVSAAASRLYPGRTLMERKLNIFYFMSKYGPDFPRALLSSVPGDLSRHWFLTIAEKDG